MVIYALFIILLIGNLFNLGIGRIFAFVYAKLGELPAPAIPVGARVSRPGGSGRGVVPATLHDSARVARWVL